MSDGRQVIASVSTDGTAYGHLLPVVEAEQRWGNALRQDFRPQRDGFWYAHMAKPLHVDRLLAEFAFPPNVRVGRGREGLTYVIDDEALVEIAAVDLSASAGPPRPPRTGLLAKILGS